MGRNELAYRCGPRLPHALPSSTVCLSSTACTAQLPLLSPPCLPRLRLDSASSPCPLRVCPCRRWRQRQAIFLADNGEAPPLAAR
jgi:hypothetical protein